VKAPCRTGAPPRPPGSSAASSEVRRRLAVDCSTFGTSIFAADSPREIFDAGVAPFGHGGDEQTGLVQHHALRGSRYQLGGEGIVRLAAIGFRRLRRLETSPPSARNRTVGRLAR
jgi:hypothetical protein